MVKQANMDNETVSELVCIECAKESVNDNIEDN